MEILRALVREEIVKAGGVPVGFETLFPGAVAPDGWLDESLDHGLILRSEFPDLWEFAFHSGNILDDAEWLARKAAQGAVGAFSLGDDATTFRIPLLTKAFLFVSDDERHPVTIIRLPVIKAI